MVTTAGVLRPLRGMTHLTSCPTGAVVIGGGLSFALAGLNSGQISKIVINQSSPASATSWMVRIFNGNLGVTVPVTFWAICVAAE